ncbi:MAG TPA: ABC transporter permease [Anaerolineae bacterium]|nr:ABC transporter permease [Anaerolineae bacterium]
MVKNHSAIPSKDGVLVLRPTKGWANLNLRDLWQYRELIYFLTWRDIVVRYKQTILGAAWAIINPVVNMIVLEVVFGRLANMGSEGLPGPIFRYAAVMPWGLFSKALATSGRSMLSNRSMITKVYFPRLIIPIASVLGGVVDFLISFLVLLGMMFYWHVAPTVNLLALPLIIVLALTTALGVGLWLSALNVLYRDIGYILPVLTQLLLFVSPVGYSTSTVGGKWQILYSLNPMVGVIEGFRWAVLGITPGTVIPLWNLLAISVGVSLVILISGLFFFRRMERTFADMV